METFYCPIFGYASGSVLHSCVVIKFLTNSQVGDWLLDFVWSSDWLFWSLLIGLRESCRRNWQSNFRRPTLFSRQNNFLVKVGETANDYVQEVPIYAPFWRSVLDAPFWRFYFWLRLFFLYGCLRVASVLTILANMRVSLFEHQREFSESWLFVRFPLFLTPLVRCSPQVYLPI